MDISNNDNSAKCFKCNCKIIFSKTIYNSHISFSCNHQICSNCLPSFLMKKHFSFLTSQSLQSNKIQIECKCVSKGTCIITYENLISLLNSKNSIETNKTNHLAKCTKHQNLFSEIYCKKCCSNLCSNCFNEHNDIFKDTHPLIFKVLNNKEDAPPENESNNETYFINYNNLCNEHNDSLIVSYCKECNKYLCEKCLNKENNDKCIHSNVFYFDKYLNQVRKCKNNLTYKTYETFSSFLSEKENNIISLYLSEISEISKSFDSLINHIHQIKSEYVSYLHNCIYKYGLIFKIFRPLYYQYYSDIESSLNIFNKKLTYLTHISQIISDIKVTLDPGKIIIDEVNEHLEKFKNHSQLYFNLINKELNSPIISKFQKKIITETPKIEEYKLKKKIFFSPTPYVDCSCTLIGHSWSVLSLIQLKDGNIASSSSDRTIKIWNIKINNLNNNELINIPLCTIKGHSNSICSLLQLTKGSNNYLISGSKDKTIKAWDISDYSNIIELYTLKGHTNQITSLIEISPTQIISSSFDSNIIIWNLLNKKEHCILSGHTKYVYCIIQIDNTGNKIASSSYKEIKIWDISSQTNEYTLTGHEGWIYSITLVKNNYILSGGYDKTIILWNLLTKTQESVITGHNLAIVSLICLNENKFISASWDKSIKIWEINGKEINNKEIATLFGHSNEVLCLCNCGLGKIASGSDDSLIKIWDLNSINIL